MANYFLGADWNSRDGNVTTVGSAGSGSASPYLTFDQGGNVWEWNEALYSASTRGVRGSAWPDFVTSYLLASGRAGDSPTTELVTYGFRVATVSSVPEASQILCGAIVVLGFWLLRRFAG